MDSALVDQRLRERDELGIVSSRRFDRKKWEKTRYIKRLKKFHEEIAQQVAALLAKGPKFEKLVCQEVDARLKAEVDRIMTMRRDQQTTEIAAVGIKGPPLKHIFETVSQVTGVSIGDLCGACRARNLAWPRHLGFHLVRTTRPDLSLPAIGKAFGGRDHTTVMHGLRKVAMLGGQSPFKEWLDDPAILALLKWKAEEQ